LLLAHPLHHQQQNPPFLYQPLEQPSSSNKVAATPNVHIYEPIRTCPPAYSHCYGQAQCQQQQQQQQQQQGSTALFWNEFHG
jgi:hypothetical protein